MSKLVARMAKMKTENLTGIGNHNQRKTEKHSNPDIEIERSHLNYDLVSRTENYKRDIEKFINDNKSTSRAVRKDAVLVNEWIISSDYEFFKDMSEYDVKIFFEVAKDYFAKNFGDENIRYAQVHLDETTPHMHLGIVPFDKENKLSAKRVFDRKALQKIQDELPKYLKEHKFDLVRGDKGSTRKHLTVPEFKKAQKEIERIQENIVEINNQIPEEVNTKDFKIFYNTEKVEVDTGKKDWLGRKIMETKNETQKDKVVMPTEKLEELLKLAKRNSGIEKQVNEFMKLDLVKDYEDLKERYDDISKRFELAIEGIAGQTEQISELIKENHSLKNENASLKNENASLKNEINNVYSQIKEILHERLKMPKLLHEIAYNMQETLENSRFAQLFVRDKEREAKKQKRKEKKEKRRNRGMSR